MAPRGVVDPATARAAMLAVADWLRDETATRPARAELAAAVRLSARTLAQLAPGGAVEVRVPPFVAVQCLAGARHTRGTPPNVVETDPRTWLLLAAGLYTWEDAVAGDRLAVSGVRAGEVALLLPVLPVREKDGGHE